MNFTRISLGLILGLPYLPVDDLVNTLLDHLDDIDETTIKFVSQAGTRMHKEFDTNNLIEKDNELLKCYCPVPLIGTILEFKKNNPNSVLFEHAGFRLLQHLIVHRIHRSRKNITPMIVGQRVYCRNGPLWLPLDKLDKTSQQGRINLVGAFLLINEILDQVTSKFSCKPDQDFTIRSYYFRRLTDPAGAIGRALDLYDTNYFNTQIYERFGLTVPDLLYKTFMAFAHIHNNDPAIFCPYRSLKKSDRQTQDQMKNIFELMSLELRSVPKDIGQVVGDISDDLYLDVICRGKPFIKVNDLYYCIRPSLINDSLANLPFHLLLTQMKRNNEPSKQRNILFIERGNAFEVYMREKSKNILGNGICSEVVDTNDEQFGDFIIEVAPGIKLIIECKGLYESDDVKKGRTKAVVKKFILPPPGSNSTKHPGPLQVMRRASAYRHESSFTGKIYTAVIYYGSFPETESFDQLFYSHTSKKDDFLNYSKDQQNRPTFLFSSFEWELILSLIAQKRSLAEILNIIDGLSPSKISEALKSYISTHKLRFSVAPIFDEEIKHFSVISKGFLQHENDN